MPSRRLAFRVAVTASGIALLAATSLPAVFVAFMAGGSSPQYGEASLMAIAPSAGGALTFLVGVAVGATLAAGPRRRPRWPAPLGALLLGASALATAYTFSPIAAIGFHPAGMAAVALAGTLLLVAGRLAPRPAPAAG